MVSAGPLNCIFIAEKSLMLIRFQKLERSVIINTSIFLMKSELADVIIVMLLVV